MDRAFIDYSKLHYPLNFWRHYDGAEVDLLLKTRTGFVAIQIKASHEWQRRFGNGLHMLSRSKQLNNARTYGVFRGPRRVDSDGTVVLPLHDFLQELWSGAIIA